MTQTTHLAQDVAPQTWRNGGGQTRELFTWPPDDESQASWQWDLRISVADITQDGPFSNFDGVTRCFAVVQGAGVALAFAERTLVQGMGDTPLVFDAAHAPACTLIDGPTVDLNVMVRSGEVSMKLIADNAAAVAISPHFGLFTRVSGTLRDGANQCVRLPAQCLFWDDAVVSGTQWHFEADTFDADPQGWWLGYVPATDEGSAEEVGTVESS
jgi:environmental stress-induced protein Ves